MKNKENIAVSKATREKAEEVLTEIQNCPNGMLRLVKGLRTDSKEVEGYRCMRESDGKRCFCEKERCIVWKDYMEMIMNEENDLDHNAEGDAVEGPVICVSIEEVLQALNDIKTGKAPGPSEVPLKMNAASGEVGIQVISVICQKVLDGLGMPTELALSIVVPIFMGKCDCICYGAVKLLEHGM